MAPPLKEEKHKNILNLLRREILINSLSEAIGSQTLIATSIFPINKQRRVQFSCAVSFNLKSLENWCRFSDEPINEFLGSLMVHMNSMFIKCVNPYTHRGIIQGRRNLFNLDYAAALSKLIWLIINLFKCEVLNILFWIKSTGKKLFVILISRVVTKFQKINSSIIHEGFFGTSLFHLW